MYSVNSAAASAWKDFFAWLADASKVALRSIDHAFPLSLSELWSRNDLGSAFMCGYPYTLSAHPPRPIAAPVPANSPVSGKPLYATRFVVRADSRAKSLEDTFGGRFGYTVEDSQSGYNAPRHHLLRYYLKVGVPLYRERVGPLFTPRRVIEALLDGQIDVGPLDSYALDLMLHYEPDLGRQIRVIDSTDPAPIPFLVAARDCPDDIVTALQKALFGFSLDRQCEPLRDRLCLAAFAPVVIEDYDMMTRWKEEARRAGYHHPG